MKIVADDKIPFLKGVLEKYAEVVYLPGDLITKSELQAADALLIRSITQCSEELLSGTAVQLIASATIGDDHIDKDFCKRNNVTWTSAKGCNAAAVEQYFTAGLLALTEKYNIDLTGKTIGIIGVGNIGNRVQKVSQLLGLKVMLNDPPRKRVEGSAGFSTLADVQEKADIITLHTPLNYGGDDKTFHLIDQAFFEGLKKSIILINSSRGSVIDSLSMKNAIEDGKVIHTLLDVWENEPEIDNDLFNLIDIATPHIAGYTLEGKANGTSLVINAVNNFFKLKLNDWKPTVPSSTTMLLIDWPSLSDSKAVQRIFHEVYPILNDDQQLRTNPDKFEELRRDYKYRRENNTFFLPSKGIPDKLYEKLAELGFKFHDLNINIQNNN
ncbi:MAG: 4-phosphoerythronate dehydrogenase [Bacteroidales bacterium]|nr:4-phosphoerythronate dehydrogenase [Bacteroidales bacterium]